MSLSGTRSDEKLRAIANPGTSKSEAESLSSPAVAACDPIDKYAPFIVRGTIIALGAAGVVIFARSIRLFTRFEHVRQIPPEFIRKQVKLRGLVAAVSNDGILRVLHRPIYRFPRIFSSRTGDEPGKLSIKLAGIELSESGSQWLRQNLGSSYTGNRKNVWFTLIKKGSNQDMVDCEVVAKLGRLPIHTSLNQELIRRGLGRVPGSEVPDHLRALRTIPAYSRLVNQLLISEQIADKRGVGMWQRETWVEAVSAYPSQIKDIVRYSTPVRFASLLAQGTKEVALTGYKTGKTALNAGANVAKVAIEVGKKSVGFLQGVYGKISGFLKKS